MPRAAAGQGGSMDAHRIGGGQATNLSLKPTEARLNPPGISVLLGGTPEDAARDVRTALPHATRLHQAARTVGTATVDDIRAAGFEVIPDPSANFPNHARLIHPDGVAGFTAVNLERLARVFNNTSVTNP